LKDQIARLSNISVNEQRLIFRGKQLDNNNFTISDYNIEPDSIITMVASLKGGFSF
jgi:adenylate cyclase class IV